MASIPARELRNDVSGVLRRVESGERLRITVSGRPVAELIPLPLRQRFMTWAAFQQHLEGGRADPELSRELAELLPETTDDLPIS